MTTNLKVGQELWYAPPRGWGQPRIVTVEKVGRKWARLDNGRRIDVTNLYADCSVPGFGRCYLSEADVLREEQLWAAWRALRDALSRRPFDRGISLDAIRQAAALLGMGDCIPEDPE